jgi:hypothetical protein
VYSSRDERGTLVVATADAAKGDLPFAHLRLHVVDAKGDRAVEPVPNAFHVASFEHDGERRPELRFLDATHVLFESHSPPVPDFVLDTVSTQFRSARRRGGLPPRPLREIAPECQIERAD